jgi:hypothetical protein
MSQMSPNGLSSRIGKEQAMKELKATVSDEEFHELEQVAKAQGLPMEEIVRRSVADYLVKVGTESVFEPIGFGMWAHRHEMQDAPAWVHELRRQEWTR